MSQLVSLIFICLIVIYPGDNAIRWINLYLVDGATGFPSLIQWNRAEIHPVDSTIQRLNNWGSDNYKWFPLGNLHKSKSEYTKVCTSMKVYIINIMKLNVNSRSRKFVLKGGGYKTLGQPLWGRTPPPHPTTLYHLKMLT